MSKLTRNAATRAFASALSPAKHVHEPVFSKDGAEGRIACLHDMCALGGGGDLLGHQVARDSHESGDVGQHAFDGSSGALGRH
jgi:hypothetical protein